MEAPLPTAYPQTAAHVRNLVREAVIDHEAFQVRIKACAMEACKATCCHDGVSLSAEEQESIQDLVASNPESFADILQDREPAGLFETKPNGTQKTAARPAASEELAADFPQHFPKTRCVFLDKNHHCALQRFSMMNGLPPWFHKPLTCWLHPILIHQPDRHARPAITLPGPGNDPQTAPDYPGFASCTHCGRPDKLGKPAQDTLEPELEMLGTISGRNLLGELRSPSLDHNS